MRKLTILLFLFHFFISFGQNEKISEEVLNDILAQRTMKYGEIRIISSLNDIYLEDYLKKLYGDNGKIYDSKAKFDKASIQLTKEEIADLVFSFRGQFDKILWKKDAFKSYKIIEFEKIVAYSRQDINNEIVEISNPIFIRNNEIALVYLANLNYGHCKGYYDLSFYKKVNGKWRMWICLKSINEKCG